jgi:hypothetical protein
LTHRSKINRLTHPSIDTLHARPHAALLIPRPQIVLQLVLLCLVSTLEPLFASSVISRSILVHLQHSLFIVFVLIIYAIALSPSLVLSHCLMHCLVQFGASPSKKGHLKVLIHPSLKHFPSQSNQIERCSSFSRPPQFPRLKSEHVFRSRCSICLLSNARFRTFSPSFQAFTCDLTFALLSTRSRCTHFSSGFQYISNDFKLLTSSVNIRRSLVQSPTVIVQITLKQCLQVTPNSTRHRSFAVSA